MTQTANAEPSTSQQLDSNNAIGLLIAASGNARLAAVRASEQLKRTVTDAEILTVVAADPNAQAVLAAQIRLFMMLHALDAFKKTHMTYLEALADLKGKDAAKAYTDLFNNLSVLTAAPTVASSSNPNQDASMPDPNNAFTQVIEALPADVADAVRFFIANPDRAPTNNPDNPPGGAGPRQGGATPATSPQDDPGPREPYNSAYGEPQPKNSGQLADPAAPGTTALTAPRGGA